jgi:hypothetical protein
MPAQAEKRVAADADCAYGVTRDSAPASTAASTRPPGWTFRLGQAVWRHERNRATRTITWRFTTADACIKPLFRSNRILDQTLHDARQAGINLIAAHDVADPARSLKGGHDVG